jgi:outer membrane protein assembly factor BamB
MEVQKGGAQKGAKREAKRITSEKQLKGLAEMSEYLAGIKGRIEAWQSGTMAPPPLQVGDVSTDDPQFVPSMGPLSLEATTEGVNRLPDTVGANGAPLWAYVKGWRFLGPLTPMDFDTCSPYLPDIVPAIGSCLIVQTNRFPWGPKNYYVGDGLSPWTGMPFDPRSGYTLPPVYSRANMVWSVRNGVLYGACMASLVVESPRDLTVWAAVGCPVRGTVWVENQLIWTSGRKEDLSNQGMMQQFKMPLKKGPNRVVVRLDTYHQGLGLTMRICVQGNPRTAEQVAKDEAAEKAAYAKVGRPYDRLCAGEMDFARQFPDCRPPLAWDLSKDINVLWRTYLPESRGGVLIVGERLFVTQEPFSLVCLNKADGKELWRQNMDPIEFLCPEIWEKEKAQVDEFDKLDVKPVPTPEESARRKTLLKEREELMKTVVPKRPPVRQCISSEAAEMKRKFEYGGGHTFAKPVSDGKHVWYKMAEGHDAMLACYDLDGRRKWARIYDKTRGGGGSSIPGLVLHGNKIICQVARYGTGPATDPNANDDDENVVTTSSATEYMDNQRRYSLMAVNKDTGEPIWESNAYPGEAFGRRFDADCVVQPGLMRLANGTETLDVVIHTAVGVVLRAEDGKELMRYCGGYSNLGVPIEDGKGTFFFSNATIQGVKFRLVDRDTITTRVMFRRDAFHEIGKKLCARDGLLNGDRLYIMQKRLSVYDTQTGLIDAKAPSELWPYQCETQVYMPSIVTGNDVLYVASTTDGGALPGAMIAVQCAPERDPIVLARNWMPGSGVSSHPVCEGDRMYARTQKEVLCIGYTGEDGRRYEAEVLAKTVLAHKLPPAVPENDPAPIQIPAKVPNRSVANEHMAWRMQPGGMVGCFLVTEPMPTAGSSWLTELFCGKARPKAGERFHAEMANSEFVQGENRVKVRGVMLGAVLAEGYGNAGGGLVTEAQAFGLKYDMGLVHCGQPGTLCMWRANLGFDRTSTWRFTSGRGTGVRAWLDGVEIKDGQRVRVPMGFYDFIVTTEAKGDEDLKGAFKPVFWPAETPEAEQAARKSLVGALRPLLEKVPKDVKDPEVTKLFKAVM